MGSEFAQGNEWNFDKALEWHQCENPWHAGVKQLVKDLNHLYQSAPALHQKDCDKHGFEWLDHKNAEQSIYAFIRYGHDEKPVIVVCNFTPEVHYNYQVGVPTAGFYQERLNTDADIYGGSNVGNAGGIQSVPTAWQNQDNSISITVPPA